MQSNVNLQFMKYITEKKIEVEK